VKPSRTIWLALGMTAALVVLLGIGSESVYALVSQAADGLVHPQSYIEAVLKE